METLEERNLRFRIPRLITGRFWEKKTLAGCFLIDSVRGVLGASEQPRGGSCSYLHGCPAPATRARDR